MCGISLAWLYEAHRLLRAQWLGDVEGNFQPAVKLNVQREARKACSRFRQT
jgi:hypothetical protein